MEKSQEESEKKQEETEEKEPETKEESELEQELSEKEIKKEQFEKFITEENFNAPVLEKIAEAQETPSLKWGAQEISTDTKKEKQNYELLEEKTTKDYQTAQERNNPIPPPILPKGEIDMQSIGRSQVQIGREFHLQEPPELKARGSAENYELINPGSIDIQKAGKEREKIGREYHPQRRQIR